MSLFSLMLRHTMKKNDAKATEGLEPITGVEEINDIIYGKNRRWNVLDIYLPENKSRESRFPVIVSVHGGAWIYGSKEIYRNYCMSLVQYGFAVINFTYRLAPHYKSPAILEDTISVFAWLKENAQRYNLDLDNLFAVGDSAGANTLSLFLNVQDKSPYCSRFNIHGVEGLAVKAVCLNFGVYQVREEHMKVKMFRQMIRQYIKGPLVQENLEALDVASFVTPSFPEAFILTSNKDFLKDSNPDLLKALDNNNVKYQYHEYGNEQRELYHCFHLLLKEKEAVEVNKKECEFFKERITPCPKP